MPTIKKGDRVRVRRGAGTALVVKQLRKYHGVFLLDRPITIRHAGDHDTSFDYFATYWTFPPADLTKVE